MTVNYHTKEFDALLIQIRNWVKDASEIEREETQADRILEARKQGNSITLPYEDSE